LRLIGHLRLDRLTPRALDQCYVKLLQGGGKNGRPLHARTVLHSHRVLHTSLEQAVRWDLLSDNPARRARPPRAAPSRATAPTPQQLARYLDVARASPHWAVVLTALATGLRRSELLALRWADVDLEQATLTVTPTVWEATGAYGLRPHKAKTEGSLRTIAIPPILVTELPQLKLRQGEMRLQVGPEYRTDLDLIFARAGGELWAPSEMGRRIKQLHTRAGLPPEVRPLHGLRHAFATESLGAGVGLKTVSERMGHARIAITADLYGHVHREVDRSAALALDAVLRPLIKSTG
jgi:integrase